MKKIVIGIVCLLLVGVAAYWYFHRDNDKARDVLPEDAAAVAVFEPAEFAEKCGLTLDDIKSVASVFGGLEEAIDLRKPVYAFTTESGMTGFSLNILDADKLVNSVSSFGFDSEEQDGLKWIVKGDDGIACLDADKMLVCNVPSSADTDAVRSEMVKLMKQSRQDVNALADVNKQDGLLRFSAPLKLLDAVSPSINSSADLKGLQDAVLNTAFQVENKALKLTARLDTPEKLQLPLAPIKGNLAGIGPAEPFIWLCVNMNGEQLLPYLRDVPELRTALLALNLNVDADMMIKAINGDVSLSIPKLDLEHPDFIFTATLTNTDFLANAADWDGISKRGDADFFIDQAGVFFGVQAGKLYIASSQRLADNAFMEAPKDAFQSAAKGKYLSASINVGQLIKSYPGIALLLRTVPQIRELTDAIERVSLTADTQQSLELSLETKKPVKDLISNLWTLLSDE